MALQVYTFSQVVSNIATAIQASAGVALNFTAGSVLRAIAEAVAGVVLWLQAIVLQLLTLTRAATSVGSDLDTWCADFGFLRLAASPASGQVTFSRFTSTAQAVVPIGANVQTADATQRFAVTLDTTNSAYNAGLGGYVLPANTASVNVPVSALVVGSDGNVQSASISVISTAIPGVDTVTNAAAFLNGLDAEADAAFRSRFVLYITSLSKGIEAAVGSAVSGIQQGLNYTITANQDYDGTFHPGYFFVVVDDGTGHASASLLTSVSTAVDAVRGLTIGFGVFAPALLTANVGMTITSAPGFDHPTVVGNVGTALSNFLNSLTLGVSVPYTQLAGVAYGVTGVLNVTGITLNSGTSDLVADKKHRVVAGTMTIS